MGAIFGNVLIALVILGVSGSLAALVIGYVGLLVGVGLAVLFLAWRMSAASVDNEHNRNVTWQGKRRKSFSFSKFRMIERQSLVDERTSDHPH